jgi:hypothetical protein
MGVVGPTCQWRWAVHVGCTRRRLARNEGVWIGAVSVIPIFPADVE